MPTQAGKVQNFQNVHVVIFPGFRVDSFHDGGIDVAWQGDTTVVHVGPDKIPVYVATGTAHAILTLNLQPSSVAIDFIDTWIRIGDNKILTLKDSSGTTFLTEANARPAKRSDFTMNASVNPYAYPIICPNFLGSTGSLNNP